MSLDVISAARAVFPFNGKSKEESWKELTAMFADNAGNVKSYILLSHPLESVARRNSTDISLGDKFRYIAGKGSEVPVKIVDCTPFDSFAFDEGSSTRMEFFLRDNADGTIVEIRRRLRGWPATWREKLFGNDNRPNLAAKQLQRIVTNTPMHSGSEWKEGETRRGDTTVERVDSYKIDF